MARMTPAEHKIPGQSSLVSRDEAWQRVVENNGLVKTTVTNYIQALTNGEFWCGMHPDDLFDEAIGAAYEGALVAAETFDESKGYQFSTYAVRVIRSHVYDALDDVFHSRNGMTLDDEGAQLVPIEYLHPDSLALDGPAERVAERVDAAAEAERVLAGLTLAQGEAISRQAEGQTYAEIALAMHLSTHQVKHLLATAKDKATEEVAA